MSFYKELVELSMAEPGRGRLFVLPCNLRGLRSGTEERLVKLRTLNIREVLASKVVSARVVGF